MQELFAQHGTAINMGILFLGSVFSVIIAIIYANKIQKMEREGKFRDTPKKDSPTNITQKKKK